MENYLTRIKKFIENEGITIYKLEQEVGCSKGVFLRAFKNNTDVVEELDSLAEQYAYEIIDADVIRAYLERLIMILSDTDNIKNRTIEIDSKLANYQLWNLISDDNELCLYINEEFDYYKILSSDDVYQNVPQNGSSKLLFDNLQKSVCEEKFDIKQKDTAYVGQNTSPNFTQDGIGITLYRNHKDYSFEWFANLPTTWGELMNFINQERLNLNLEKLIEILQSHTNLKHIFVECAIPRPTNIVGKEDNLERLCFYISKEDLLSGKENAPIMYVRIYDFLTQTKAAQISNTPPSLTKKKILILGCGAVGSKLLAHLYRSGICNITICDNDLFEAHNVVRHILFDSSKTLQYKVKLIKEILDTMYVGPTNIQSINEDAVFFIRNANLDKFDLIIDTTASNRVMYALDEVKTQCPIFRFALANRGSIGLQYVKAGEHTSLKDFYATIMQKYIQEEDTESLEYKSLKAWFSPRSENDFDDIRTGESCRSITMKISDELISYHTSMAAIKVKQILSMHSLKDTISLSFIDKKTQDISAMTFHVPQWESHSVKDGWNVKMTHDLFVQFGKMTAEYKSIENGGYLIGYCDEKHKLIYLIGHYEPSDTVHKPDEVSLGVSGWSEYLTKMQKLTGDKIRYLGDWHSHPRGTTTCSAKDQMMFEKLRREIKDVGVCLITTRIQIKPYPLNIGG